MTNKDQDYDVLARSQDMLDVAKEKEDKAIRVTSRAAYEARELNKQAHDIRAELRHILSNYDDKEARAAFKKKWAVELRSLAPSRVKGDFL